LETDAQPIVYRHGMPGTFWQDHVPITNAVSTSFSIQSFKSSEPGALSNSYLIAAGKSDAILFDVSMLQSDA
jgi:hypothetical protein